MSIGSAILLSDDHSEIDKILEEVFAALRTSDHTRAFASLDRLWARLAMHIRAENLHLFPAIAGAISSRPADQTLSTAADSALRIIENLRADHNFFMRQLVKGIKRMRRSPKGHDLPLCFAEVTDLLADVRLRLISHNNIEESSLYPLAAALLSADALAELRRKIRKELDNLPPRFAAENSEQ